MQSFVRQSDILMRQAFVTLHRLLLFLSISTVFWAGLVRQLPHLLYVVMGLQLLYLKKDTICAKFDECMIQDCSLRACSHEPGTVNYPGVMIASGQALPRVHMMICCPESTSLPRGRFIDI